MWSEVITQTKERNPVQTEVVPCQRNYSRNPVIIWGFHYGVQEKEGLVIRV